MIKLKSNTSLVRVAIFSGFAVSFIGLLGLCGWVTGVRELASVRAIYLPMSPDTSLVFIVLGLIVILTYRRQYSRWSKIFISIIAVVISIYGLLKFVEYFANADLTLENILFPVTERIGTFSIKRMSPLAGILFFFSGIALQLKVFLENRQKLSNLIGIFGMITLTIGFTATVGYLFGTPLYYGGIIIPLAAPTAIGFLLLGCGLMAIAGTDSIFIRPFIGSSANIKLIRVLLPLVVLAILIQGFLYEKLFTVLGINQALFSAMLSLIFAAITAGIVLQLSRVIFREADIAEIERKKAEEINLQLASIIESSEDAIIGKTMDGIITSWNTGAEKMYGYTKEQAINQPISIIIPPDLQYEMIQILEKIRVGQHIDHYETVRVRKDGTKINVSISISSMCDGKGILIGASSIARDISERKRTDEELRKLSRAVEQSPASIVITDTKGAIEYVNPKFVQITGYSLEEAIGKNPRILKSGEKPSKEYKQLWDMINSGNEWHGEFHNKKKNGELYWESAVISSITDVQSIVTHFLAVKEDITQRKEAEAEREKLIIELQQALADVKTLGGLIPICSSCKKIRDDQGYWNILEAYLMKHSDAKFTHGMCPECMAELYPDFVDDKTKKEEKNET
jgi:sigma-B regulation protein RsbU (phosphoserine phosphatase)